MKNYVAPGASIAAPAPYAVTSGQGALLALGLFGVAAVTLSSGATGEFATTGVFDITKAPSLAIPQGAILYWDNTNRRLTTQPTANTPCGVAFEAALAADATVRAFISPGLGIRDLAVPTRELSVQAVAQTNTDFVIPCGTPIALIRAFFATQVAYTGATATIQLGAAAGGNNIVAATDIKAAGVVDLTIIRANSLSLGTGSLHVRLAQTTPTAVGTGLLIMEFASGRAA